MHKDYCVENLHNVKYFIKLLVASIVISSKLIAASPLEAPPIVDTGELGLDGHRESAKFNTPATKANTSTDLHIASAGSCRIKGVFNDPPVAVGVVVESEDVTIEYTNQILLKEDSVYEGILGGVATNMSGTLKFGIEYQPIHGEVKINEKTGEFSYVSYSSGGPDSFGYFVSNDSAKPIQKSKYKQIFVSVQPIIGGEAFKKTLKEPSWGYWHYLNCVKCRLSRETAKFNTPTTKANTDNDHYIGYRENSGSKGFFNDPPVAVGVVVGAGDGVIEYTNKISLEEDSVYEGTLGGVATNMSGTLKFGIDYQPRQGVVEIDEITGEFFYVPNNPNFRGPDSFGYFVSNDCLVTDNSVTPMPRQKSKHKQIFVSVMPITGGEAFKKTLKQPLWGFWHYLNCVKCRRS